MKEISDNKIYYWLSSSGIGSKRINAALSIYSPAEIYYQLPQEKVLQDFFGKHTAKLLATRDESSLDKKLFAISGMGIRILTLASDKYPEALKQSEVSPPTILYYRGSLDCLSAPCLAIVGTRHSSQYGKTVAKNLSREFCLAGATVVSGLATGIDTFSHEVAAELGRTAAVLGGGHNHINSYSVALANRIVDGGGVVLSEYPPDFVPTKYSFPERNRIISGLSRAVVVVEAGEKSGALITADFALEQGREVYAVPGEIFSARSKGTNGLLKNGLATALLCADDILIEQRIKENKTDQKSPHISLDFFEQKIYNLLQSGKMHYDELVPAVGISAAELSSQLFSLEIKGVIVRLPSNFYSLEGTNS